MGSKHDQIIRGEVVHLTLGAVSQNKIVISRKVDAESVIETHPVQ